jgi:hypothetical protein
MPIYMIERAFAEQLELTTGDVKLIGGHVRVAATGAPPAQQRDWREERKSFLLRLTQYTPGKGF